MIKSTSCASACKVLFLLYPSTSLFPVMPFLRGFLICFHSFLSISLPYPYTAFSVRPTGQPTGAPTGQPTMQPSSRPTVSPSLGISKRPTGQPTSYPSRFEPFPIVAGAATVGGLSTQSAIIIFSAVGAIVLCLFVCFSCYFQHKFINKEEDRIHSLVEENFDDDDIILDDGEGGEIVDNESMYYRQFGEVETPMHTFKDKDGNLVPGTPMISFFVICLILKQLFLRMKSTYS